MTARVAQLGLVLLALAACTTEPTPDQTADAIYLGGDIVTMNDAQPTAEAVAVKAGRILAVGSRAEVERSHLGATTRTVDLAGRTLLPGFIDAHGHLSSVGSQAASASLLAPPDGDVTDLASLGAKLAAHRDSPQARQSGWVIGMGYDDAQLAEKRHPTAEDIDAVVADLPVLLVHQSGHLGVVNSRGLALLGYDVATRDPPGGVLRREAGSSRPNGVLEESALFSVLGKLPAGDEAATVAQVEGGQQAYVAFGFTTAQEGRATAANLAGLEAAARQGRLEIDVAAYPDPTLIGDQAFAEIMTRASPSYENHYRIAGMKLSLDGSPQGKTAWLTQPYHVPPEGRTADYAGYPAMAEADVERYVGQAFASRFQVLVHANGDAAADQMIRVVRAATEEHGAADRRPVMIHAQTVREDQLDAMKELGIIPSFFSMHTFYWGDWHRDSVLGPERAARISPARSALDRGMVYTSHHDAPVALPSSIMILATQVNRTTRSGQVLGADQRVSVIDALRSLTINAAHQYFEENEKGSIEPGKLADLVILDRNPLEVPPEELWGLRAVETIKEGRTVFAAR